MQNHSVFVCENGYFYYFLNNELKSKVNMNKILPENERLNFRNQIYACINVSGATNKISLVYDFQNIINADF